MNRYISQLGCCLDQISATVWPKTKEVRKKWIYNKSLFLHHWYSVPPEGWASSRRQGLGCFVQLLFWDQHLTRDTLLKSGSRAQGPSITTLAHSNPLPLDFHYILCTKEQQSPARSQLGSKLCTHLQAQHSHMVKGSQSNYRDSSPCNNRATIICHTCPAKFTLICLPADSLSSLPQAGIIGQEWA